MFVVILFLTRFHQRVGTIILEKLFKSGVIVRILPSPLRLSGLIFLSQLAFDVFEKFLAFSFNKLLFLALLPYGYVLTCLCFPRGNTWGLFKKGRSFVLIATFNQLLSLTGFFLSFQDLFVSCHFSFCTTNEHFILSVSSFNLFLTSFTFLCSCPRLQLITCRFLYFCCVLCLKI